MIQVSNVEKTAASTRLSVKQQDVVAVSLVGSPDPTRGSMHFTNTYCNFIGNGQYKSKIIKKTAIYSPQLKGRNKVLRTR